MRDFVGPETLHLIKNGTPGAPENLALASYQKFWLCAGKCKTSHLTWYLAFNAFARRRRRRCGNVGTRVLCGFPSFEGDMLFTDQRTHFAPSKRHFHSGPSLLACFVRFSIVNCLKNRLPLLQKPASNDVFYTFLRRARYSSWMQMCQKLRRSVASLLAETPQLGRTI